MQADQQVDPEAAQPATPMQQGQEVITRLVNEAKTQVPQEDIDNHGPKTATATTVLAALYKFAATLNSPEAKQEHGKLWLIVATV